MGLKSHQIIKGIIVKDRLVLEEVYRIYFPMIRQMVFQNNGDLSAAKDVFQEGLLVMFEKLSNDQGLLQINFAAYLHGVCKKLWLMKIRRNKLGKEKMDQLPKPIGDLEAELDSDLLRAQRFELYRKCFLKLGEDCQQVLTYFFEKKALKEIAVLMNFSEQYAKKKKYTCQKKLIESIENNPQYKDLRF